MTSVTFNGSGALTQSIVDSGIGSATEVIIQGYSSIGLNAFQNRANITSISIPSSVNSIGNRAFEGTGITSISIPSNVTAIGNYIFKSTPLTSITISSNITSIGTHAFEYCFKLTSITIPSSVTFIDSGAFKDCTGLISVTLSSNHLFTNINNSIFENCTSLTSITIPSNVTSISSAAFINCTSLTSITISSMVTSIGSQAFKGCTSLSSISIPSSVTSIGSVAFQNCTSLTSVTILNPANVTTLNANSFPNVSSENDSTITFRNTNGYDNLSSTWKTISTYYQNQIYGNQPTITNFTISSALYGSSDITITSPSSDSTGAFTYSSSDPNIATISGSVLSVHKIGTTIITATQTAASGYTEGTATANFSVFCFNQGTGILTTELGKYTLVEDLQVGDLVATYQQTNKEPVGRKIVAIKSGTFINNPKVPNQCMYVMKKSNNILLTEDLYVTGGHSILVNSLQGYEKYKKKMMKMLGSVQMIQDKYLLLVGFSKDFEKVTENKEFTYYHFLLESENEREQYGVWANGILAETPSKYQWYDSKM